MIRTRVAAIFFILTASSCSGMAINMQAFNYPSRPPLAQGMDLIAGLLDFADLRPYEEKSINAAASPMGASVAEQPGPGAAASLAWLVTNRFQQDANDARLFQKIIYPRETGNKDILLRGSMLRFGGTWSLYLDPITMSLCMPLGLPVGKNSRNIRLRMEAVDPRTDEVLAASEHAYSNNEIVWGMYSSYSWPALDTKEWQKGLSLVIGRIQEDLLAAKVKLLAHKAPAGGTRMAALPSPQKIQAADPGTGAQMTGVAVYPFAAKGGADGSLAEGLTSVLSSEVAAAPCVRIVAEDVIQDLAKQQGLEQQCGTESCQIDLAKQAQADVIVRGDLARVGSTYILTALVIDLKSRQTIFSERMNSPESGLIQTTETLARKAAGVLGCRN